MKLIEVYSDIYNINKKVYMTQGHTEDKASRRASILAVKNTWKTYNDLKSYQD